MISKIMRNLTDMFFLASFGLCVDLFKTENTTFSIALRQEFFMFIRLLFCARIKYKQHKNFSSGARL